MEMKSEYSDQNNENLYYLITSHLFRKQNLHILIIYFL